MHRGRRLKNVFCLEFYRVKEDFSSEVAKGIFGSWGLLLPLPGSVYKQHTTMAAVHGGTKLRSQVRQQSREMGLGSNPFTIHPQGVNDLLKGPTSERLHCFPQSHSGSKSSAMS